jgi:hypothetical protein
LAVVLWFVVPLGLIVTLLFGIALNVESVFTDVLALGLVVWLEIVPVLLLARGAFVASLVAVVPVPVVVPAVVPVPVADVPVFVVVVWLAVVLWFVVPLGLIVTVLFGIALNVESVLTVVLALGLVVWLEIVLVSLLLVWANTAPPIAANTAAAMTESCLRIMRISPRKRLPRR